MARIFRTGAHGLQCGAFSKKSQARRGLFVQFARALPHPRAESLRLSESTTPKFSRLSLSISISLPGKAKPFRKDSGRPQ